MGRLESFDCSWSLELSGSVGVVQGFGRSPAAGMSEKQPWTVSGTVPPPIMGSWETVTCMNPKELRPNCIPRGILTGKSASSNGGGPDLSAHEPVNPGDASGSLLCMRANSPGWAVPSASEASCMLGAGRVVGSSSWGSSFCSSEEALSVGTEGVTGSFLTTYNMVISNGSPFSSREARHLWSSWTAPHRIPGSIPDCMVQHWSAWASATVSSPHVT